MFTGVSSSEQGRFIVFFKGNAPIGHPKVDLRNARISTRELTAQHREFGLR